MNWSIIKRSIHNHRIPMIALLLLVGSFFWPVFFLGKIPTAADTIVGLYHPWRDMVWNNYVAGVPFKNFLITDPVRQQYPWRSLAIDLLKRGEMPAWNPYTFTGTPLFANIQSAAFYPLNIFFLLFPFPAAWAILIILQPVLGSIFTYLYLRLLRCSRSACFFGGTLFAFCGFSVAWMTWNTIGHVFLWLPASLFFLEKTIIEKKSLRWITLLCFAILAISTAGHWQTAFYMLTFFIFYLGTRSLEIVKKGDGREKKRLIIIYSCLLIVGIFIAWLVIPSFQFISQSNRSIDQAVWEKIDWFIPWQHIVQFLAPDFFGNPATMNYWGAWNYGEFVGYIGISGIFFAVYGLIKSRFKVTLFFTLSLFTSIIFAFQTPIGRLPFILQLPFVSSAQPSRLISVIDFSLVILAAFGFDQFLNNNRNSRDRVHKTLYVSALLFVMVCLWIVTMRKSLFGMSMTAEMVLIAQKNLILPSLIVVVIVILSLIHIFSSKVVKKYPWLIVVLMVLLSIIDVYRFAWKFTPFSDQNWLYPRTKSISYLQNQKQQFRFMSTDSRIFPPNFSLMYKLQTVDGYDPLYLQRYGEYVAAWNNGRADKVNASFNRIVTPQTYESRLADLSNVRFIFSLKDELSPKLYLIMREGETRLYENTRAFPRIFLVEKVKYAHSPQEVLTFLLDEANDLRTTAVVESPLAMVSLDAIASDELATITSYTENDIIVHTSAKVPRFLVFTDAYYPGWNAYVDGEKTPIYRTDYIFRGIVIPPGTHEIVFRFSAYL